MNKPLNAKRGFTLIELLTVIAILAILGAIIFPTVGQFRTLAKKSSDSSDLRNIVQASQLFAAQNGERLVGIDQTLSGDGIGTDSSADLVDVAAVLAWGGELEDPLSWVSSNEPLPSSLGGGLYTVSTAAGTEGDLSVSTTYSPQNFSYSYVRGLQTSDSANTPVVFTRIDPEDSTWDATDGPYGVDGGHVAFLGGSVSFYQDLTGKLVGPTGAAVNNISAAIPDRTSTVDIAEASAPAVPAGP